jgi:hypothetical protein
MTQAGQQLQCFPGRARHVVLYYVDVGFLLNRIFEKDKIPTDVTHFQDRTAIDRSDHHQPVETEHISMCKRLDRPKQRAFSCLARVPDVQRFPARSEKRVRLLLPLCLQQYRYENAA